MTKIAIVFGSSTGTTESVASKIQSHFDNAELFNADGVNAKDLENFDFLIFGASTTGVGDLQDDWEILLPSIEKLDLKNKKVALFGLGDSASFSTSFAGGMRVIYDALNKKTTFIGAVPTDGYEFDDSEAIIDDKFVGLALDEDNEYDKTDERIEKWVAELKKAL